MKLAIQQKTLLSVLDRGCLAALSEEAQTDTTPLALLIKAVKIKIEPDKLTVESATSAITSRYVLPVDKTGDIVCKEAGEVLVPAKELYDWVSRQKDSKLALALKLLDTPEIINPLSAEADGAGIKGVKRIGSLQIQSKDEYGTGSKWSLNCYAPGQMVDSVLDLPATVQFSIPVKQLNTAFKNVAFAAMPKHYQHLYDSISFQKYENKLYLLACDTARAAVYEASEAKQVNMDNTLLVPAKFFGAVIKLAEENEDLNFYYQEATDKTPSKIFLAQGDRFIVKLTTSDPENTKKYAATASLLLSKKYASFATIIKSTIMRTLVTITLVNETAALFQFKDNKLSITGNSNSGKEPITGDAALKGNTAEFSVVWNVNHLLDFLKLLQEDEVPVARKEGIDNTSAFMNKSLKLTSQQDSLWSYFVMPQDPVKTKYD